MRQKLSLSTEKSLSSILLVSILYSGKTGGKNDPVKQDHCSNRSTQQKHLCSQIKISTGGLGLLLVVYRAVMEQKRETK